MNGKEENLKTFVCISSKNSASVLYARVLWLMDGIVVIASNTDKSLIGDSGLNNVDSGKDDALN